MKFKKLVEQSGFKLVNGMVVNPNATSSPSGAVIKSKAARGGKRKATGEDSLVSKRTKVQADEDGADSSGASEGRLGGDEAGAHEAIEEA